RSSSDSYNAPPNPFLITLSDLRLSYLSQAGLLRLRTLRFNAFAALSPLNNYAKAISRIYFIAVDIESFRLNSRSSPLRSNPPIRLPRSSPNTPITGRRVDSVCLRCGVPGYYSNKCSLRPACRPPKLSIRFVDTVEDSDADLESAGKRPFELEPYAVGRVLLR
ncbi:hypothetical protein L249_0149, partial [Ophiocordyceps polyrhachis-furcata BCC 54312]